MRVGGFALSAACFVALITADAGIGEPIASAAPLDVTPMVSSVTPASGSVAGGTAIVIAGTGFTDTTDVFIGGTDVSAAPCPSPGGCFTFVSDSEIDATTPSGAAGTSDVIVKNPTFQSSPNPPSDSYTFVQSVPTITSVSPNAGPESGGPSAITISGSNFMGSGFTTTGVSFGGSAATFSVSNPTTIMATSPSGTGLIDIAVTTASTDGTSQQTSVTSSADTYVYAPVPAVTSVAPTVGPAVGQNTVTLSGSGYESINGASNANFTTTDVFVDTTAITTSPCPGSPTSPCFTVGSQGQITVQDMPSHAPGTVDIRVQTPGGTSTTSASDQYTFQPLPTVTSVVPPDGVLAGGGTVTVDGTGFTGASVVSVGSTAVLACPGSPCFNIVSPTQITVDFFPGSAAPATVDITVTTPFGASVASPPGDSYTYMPIPIVTSVTPNAGATAGGNPVTVTGSGFEFGGFIATTVSVVGAGNAASFIVNSATSITIPAVPAYPPAGGTCPSNPPATGVICHITVTTAGGTSLATSSGSIYTYVAKFPNVLTVSPKYGAESGGAYVAIFGQYFGDPSQGFGATEVDFGTTSAGKVLSSSTFPCPGSARGCFSQIGTTTIVLYTPAVPAGTVDIRVVTPGGTSNVAPPADQYTFVAAGAYTAVNPFRTCDTRKAAPGIASNQCDTAGKGTLGTGHETITAQITGGPVSATAQAVVVNITAINHSSSGTYVIAFPAGGSQPVATNLSLAGGKVESNLAIVRLGVGGQISLFNAVGSVDVIVDVEGYFAAASVGSPTGAFHAIPPLRICDSRGGTLCATATGSTSAPLVGGVWRHVILSGLPSGAPSNTPSVPSDGTAAAAAFNLTATAGTAYTYLSVAVPTSTDACPTRAPSFSNVNPAPGTSLPIRVISNLGPKQDICLYSAAGRINFIIDNNGWFGTSSASGGALFYSVPPTRICDTRPSFGSRCQTQALSANFSELVHVAGIVAVPTWTTLAPKPLAFVANLTGVAGSSATYLTLYPSDEASPPRASDLNPTAGEVIANLAITSLAQTGTSTTPAGNVKLYNALGSINAILDVAGWFQ